MNRQLLKYFDGDKERLKHSQPVLDIVLKILDDMESSEYQKLLNGENDLSLLRAINKLKASVTIGDIS